MRMNIKICDACNQEIKNANYVEIKITENHVEIAYPIRKLEHYCYYCYNNYKKDNYKEIIDQIKKVIKA
jgi:hypothetical protein